MAMFNSYVSLPEGIYIYISLSPQPFTLVDWSTDHRLRDRLREGEIQATIRSASSGTQSNGKIGHLDIWGKYHTILETRFYLFGNYYYIYIHIASELTSEVTVSHYMTCWVVNVNCALTICLLLGSFSSKLPLIKSNHTISYPLVN